MGNLRLYQNEKSMLRKFYVFVESLEHKNEAINAQYNAFTSKIDEILCLVPILMHRFDF